MKIIKTLLLAAAVIVLQNAKAQTAAADSANTVSAAKWDARRFRLSSEDYKKFSIEHFAPGSDYFKPDKRTTSNPAMLNDSLYVQTFKTAAFYIALDQRTLPTLREVALPRHGVGLSLTRYSQPVQQAAQKDARSFSLTKDLLIKFKAAPFATTSDYFKPGTQTTSNPALLSDSTYVETFRFEAFNKTYHQRIDPVGHALLIGGGITVVSLSLLIVLITALSHIKYY
jgi:hypothetical protein